MDSIAKGNFIANKAYSRPGSNKPNFRGKLSMPGSGKEYEVALWTREFTDPKTGEQRVYHAGSIGDVALTDDAMSQIRAVAAKSSPEAPVEVQGVELRPGQLFLFENKFKDAPRKDGGKSDKSRPDFWGRLNPGNGEPVVALGVWARNGEYGLFLSGETSYPQPGRDVALDGVPAADVEQMAGASTKPRKGRAEASVGSR